MLKQRISGETKEFFDPVRKKWVPATPEEEVRQQFIQFLLTVKQVPLSHISVEREICVNGLSRRYDLVVFNEQGIPWMVVECKAPHIALTQEVMEQAGRYNKTLRAPIIGITNGNENKFFQIDFDTEAITML